MKKFCYLDKKKECTESCAVYQDITRISGDVLPFKSLLTACGAINTKIIERFNRFNEGKRARVSIDD